MAVTATSKLALNKQDAGDASWHTALNAGFDNAEARFMRFGTADPNVGETCNYVGQLYIRTSASPPRIWIGTVAASPGTWLELSQLSAGEAAVAAVVILNNTIALQAKESGGTARDVAVMNGSNKLLLGALTNLLTLQTTGATNLKVEYGSGEQTVWHAGNDGDASGLDADLVKGLAPLGAGNAVGYFQSADQTLKTSALDTIAHGLGAAPKLAQVLLKNTTGEHGYSVGDIIHIGSGLDWTDGFNTFHGWALSSDATNLYLTHTNHSLAPGIPNKSTGAASAITFANWRLVLRAWI